jgi:hypothetical protein
MLAGWRAEGSTLGPAGAMTLAAEVLASPSTA